MTTLAPSEPRPWRLVALADNEKEIVALGDEPGSPPVIASVMAPVTYPPDRILVDWGGARALDHATDIALLPAGMLLLGEVADHIAVQKITGTIAPGTPPPIIDLEFGEGGTAFVPLDRATALASGPDESVLVAGEHDDHLCVVKLDHAGVWDRGFGVDGFACLSGGSSHARAIGVDHVSRVLVAGDVENLRGGTDAVVARFWL